MTNYGRPRFDTGFGRATVFFLLFLLAGVGSWVGYIWESTQILLRFLRLSPFVFLAEALDEHTKHMYYLLEGSWDSDNVFLNQGKNTLKTGNGILEDNYMYIEGSTQVPD